VKYTQDHDAKLTNTQGGESIIDEGYPYTYPFFYSGEGGENTVKYSTEHDAKLTREHG